MKTFHEYVDEHDAEQPNEQPDVKQDMPDMSDDLVYRVMKTAWRKHRSETEAFLKTLAEKDQDLQAMLKDAKSDEPVGRPHEDDEQDEVVPAMPDGSPGIDQGGGE